MRTGGLTALKVKKLMRERKPGLKNDGGGLYFKDGSSWIYRYEGNDGKKHDMGLGSALDISLAEARELAAAARKLRREGKDPIIERRASRAASAMTLTFGECAAQCFKAHASGWRSAVHAAQWEQTLRDYAKPLLDMPVQAVSTEHVMLAVGDLWQVKPQTASRLRGRIESILDWAKVRGYRDGENPARWRGHLDHLLPAARKVKRVQHHAALPYAEIADFMRDLRKREGRSARALEFCILTATRTSETLYAQWHEVDFAAKLWIIPAIRTKAAREHRIPLSERALEILAGLAAIRGGDSGFVFPGRRCRPLAKLALFGALRRMGRGAVTAHGFRATFKTWSAEATSFPSEVVEMALGHAVGNKVEAAYQRGDMMEKRRIS